MRFRAYAKINLVLNILFKRPDGFHELQSIMQTVSLHDTLELCLNEEGRIISYCDHDKINSESENLVDIAAKLFMEESQLDQGVTIHLQKKVPIAAGLGGGSSDAAITLIALNRLFNGVLSDDTISRLAGKLGSDVPFFIRGGTALAQGRGELMTAMPFIGHHRVLLINPGFEVKTPVVYSHLNLPLTSKKPDHNILPALGSGSIPVKELCHKVHNDLQETVLRLYPEVQEIVDWLRSCGAPAVAVSGSGGTVFAIFDDDKTAEKMAEKASALFPWIYLGTTIPAY